MEVMKVEAKVVIQLHPIKKNNLKQFLIENTSINSRNFKLISNAANTNGIETIEFSNCNLVEFPRAHILLDLVKNLTSLYITNCNLTKITGDVLRGFGSLTELYVNFTSIETLPKGLFVHTPNLEIVSFWHNRIKEIDENILDPLKNLKYFNLSENLKIDIKFGSTRGNVTLTQLRDEIKKCRPTEDILKELYMVNSIELKRQVNALRTIRKDFSEMKTEISNMKTENAYILFDNQNLNIGDEMLRKELAEINTALLNIKRENQNLKISNEILKNEITELKTNCIKLTAELNQLKPFNFTVVVNGKNFQVNKEILAANSPVLANLIGENHDANRLLLRNITEETFEEVLKFMLTKNLPNQATDLIELYAASARLEMKDLMELTAEILMEKVTSENALRIFTVSEKYNHKELSKKALKELVKKFCEN